MFERVADLQRSSDIASYIDARHALLVVQIGQNFERELLAGRGADVQVIADGRNSNTAGTAIGYVNSIVQQFNSDWRRRTWLGRGAGTASRVAPGTTRISRPAGT